MTTDPIISQAKVAVDAGHTPPKVRGGGSLEDMKKTARDFEAMFLSEVLKPMFDSIEIDPVFGGGDGERMFRSMLVDEYGKKIAASGGVGLADSLVASMIKMQEEGSR